MEGAAAAALWMVRVGFGRVFKCDALDLLVKWWGQDMSAQEEDKGLDSDRSSQASEESFHSACSVQDAEDAALAAGSWDGDTADGDQDASQFASKEADDMADLMQRVTVQAKPDGLCSIDARCGVTMFFRNEFQQSEDFLSLGKDSIPVFAVSHGVITMLKALMTFDEQIKLQAMARLNHAEALSCKLAGYDGFFAGIGKKFASVLSRKKKSLTKDQIEARISIAESQFAKSLLCFLDESVSGFVRGSMGMRRAWHSYNQCSNDISDNAHLQLTPSDRDGVFFGLGVFNLVLGILPPRVLRIVKLLGFGGDRDEGLKQLHMCMDAGGVRSVLAVVALLAYHVLVPSFFSLPQAMSYHIEQADAIIQKAMIEYPGSAFLTFLQGRHERLKRNLPGSLEALSRSLSVVRKGAGADWVQFADLCSYELAWTLAQMQQWNEAADAFYSLYETNNWSKCFYVYACAVCRLMAGRVDECIRCMKLAKTSTRPLGGKLISVEAFIVRKIASSSVDTREGLQSPVGSVVGWELLYLWNSVPMIAEGTLQAMVQAADVALAASKSHDERAVPLLLRGAALGRLGFYADSMAALNAAVELEGKLQHDTYVPPFALYELGAVHCAQAQMQEAADVFAKCAAVSYDFNFEVRFRMRLAGASAWMERNKK